MRSRTDEDQKKNSKQLLYTAHKDPPNRDCFKARSFCLMQSYRALDTRYESVALRHGAQGVKAGTVPCCPDPTTAWP